MASTLKHKIISGVFWQGLTRLGTHGINFILGIVLARLLAPEDFGVVALLMIFTALAGVFIDSGFSTALIQKKDADNLDCSSVFYLNAAAALVLYGIIWLAAPAAGAWYGRQDLITPLRYLALVLILRSVSLVHGTLLTKRMLFHLSFRITLPALLLSGAAGIVLAYGGAGVWALITQQLVNAAATSIGLWLAVKWRPQWIFSRERLRGLFSFGWKLFCSALLDTLYDNLYGLLFGKLFNLSTLAYYNRGQHIPCTGMSVINSTIGTVMFPAFAEIQEDRERMRELARRGMRTIMFFVLPLMTVLAVTAEPLVRILLTDKWLPCVIFLQLSCLIFAIYPFHTLNLQIINACGRSDIFLILEVIKKVQGIAVILITWRYGIWAMVWGMVINNAICAFENAWPSGKLIGYPPWRQFWDILPMLLIAAIGGGIVFAGLRYVGNPWVQLFAAGGIFAALYLAISCAAKQIPAEITTILKNKRTA